MNALPIPLLLAGMLATGSVLVTTATSPGVLVVGRALSDATLAMLCGVLAAVPLLGVRAGHRLRDVMAWCERAVADVAMMLLIGILPVYWSVAMARMSGLMAAAGLAFINTVGLLGGFERLFDFLGVLRPALDVPVPPDRVARFLQRSRD